MIDIPSFRPETRYGIPTADLYLMNRQYIVGYSFLFRQPRWALELIDEDSVAIKENLFRLDNFRVDMRVPESFRSTLKDYIAEKHPVDNKALWDRGHLVSSANRRSKVVLNSETFLLSNMSPQARGFNRGIWKELDEAVRQLARQTDEYVEVYAVCGPLFDVDDDIKVIGTNRVVVPHGYFKSVLAERKTGRFDMWSFMIPNEEQSKPISSFRCTTDEVERRAGLSLWDRLRGEDGDALRRVKRKMWSLADGKTKGSKTNPSRETKRMKRASA
jgi:endonuclease G, mitochondrial